MVVALWWLITMTPWLLHAGGAVLSDFSGPCLTMSMIFSVTFAFLWSVRCYYVLLQPMRSLITAREYTGVYPQLPAVAFPDAAFVKFAGNVILDKSRAVSYNTLDSGAVTFCVAPITTEANVGRVEFWAYGVDCCGDSGGKFECDDADDSSAKSGWVLQNSKDELWRNLGLYISPPDTRREVYVEAVKKAEAYHKLSSPGADAVFVKWTKNKKKDLITELLIHVGVGGVILMLCLGALSFCMTRLYQRFSHVRVQHRKMHQRGHHNDVDNTEEEDFTQRMEEFLADTLEGAAHTDMGGTLDRIANFNPADYRQNLSLKDTIIMNVLLPYTIAMLCVVLLTYASCWTYAYLIIVPFYCMLAIFIFAWLVTPHRAVTGVFMLMVAVNGSYVGHVNYRENMFHYCSVGKRRSYEGVLADGSAEEYGDAGKLQFEASARLRTDLSVGFLYHDETYCVAPVISDTSPCAQYNPTVMQYVPGNQEAQSLLQDHHHVVHQHHPGNRRSKIASSKLRHSKGKKTLMAPSSSQHRGEFTNFLQQTSHHHSKRAHHHSRRAHGQRKDHHCMRPTPARLEWWAIGKNCCEPQGDFWCDGGEVAGAHAAVVVRKFPQQAYGEVEEEIEELRLQGGDSYLDDREHFFQAINKSVAKFSLPMPEKTVLLRWGPNAEDLENDWYRKAAKIVIKMSISSFVVIFLIALVSHCYVRYMRQQEKRAFENYQSKHQAGQAGLRPEGSGPSLYDQGYNASDSRPSLAPLRSSEDVDNRLHAPRNSEDEYRRP